MSSSTTSLLADTLRLLPRVRMILCEPFGLPVGSKKEVWETYYPQLLARQRIVGRLAEKHTC